MQVPATKDFDAGRKPDAVFESRIRGELRRCAYPAVRRIGLSIEDGVLTLSGQVPDDFQKQLAQRVVEPCLADMVLLLDNRLDIVPDRFDGELNLDE